MPYDRNLVYEKAIKAIEANKLLFIEDVVTYLPCTKTTFYDYYPPGSNELNLIKAMLNDNKVKIKVAMRSKWYQSENATLQMGLYKLCSTKEERMLLSQTFLEVDANVKAQTNTIDWDKLSPEQLEALRDAKIVEDANNPSE